MKLKWISIIAIGLMLIGGQAFVANEVRAESQTDVLINSFGNADVSADEFAASAVDVLPAPAFTDLSYSPVTPCRVVDSRIGRGGLFVPGERQEYYVYGPSLDLVPQGGNPAGCSSPRGEPSAVHINLTAVPTSGQGNFRAFPANVSPPNASLTNYRAGVQNVANAATIRTYNVWGPKEIEIMNSYGYAYCVIDVMGYYYPNPWH